MPHFVREHSLSLFLGGLFLALTVAAFVLDDGPVQEYVHNLAGDAFGAVLVVIATKWLRERGSPQSK